MHALGLEFGRAARLSKRPRSVWNCLWGHALKRSAGIIRKSRVSYPGPGFLSSATWHSLLKKHYNRLTQTCISPGMVALSTVSKPTLTILGCHLSTICLCVYIAVSTPEYLNHFQYRLPIYRLYSFEKIVIRICLKFQNLLKDLF